MRTERKRNINGNIVEEFRWGGTLVVYVNNLAYEETFEQACNVVKTWKPANEKDNKL